MIAVLFHYEEFSHFSCLLFTIFIPIHYNKSYRYYREINRFYWNKVIIMIVYLHLLEKKNSLKSTLNKIKTRQQYRFVDWKSTNAQYLGSSKRSLFFCIVCSTRTCNHVLIEVGSRNYWFVLSFYCVFFFCFCSTYYHKGIPVIKFLDVNSITSL